MFGLLLLLSIPIARLGLGPTLYGSVRQPASQLHSTYARYIYACVCICQLSYCQIYRWWWWLATERSKQLRRGEDDGDSISRVLLGSTSIEQQRQQQQLQDSKGRMRHDLRRDARTYVHTRNHAAKAMQLAMQGSLPIFPLYTNVFRSAGYSQAQLLVGIQVGAYIVVLL